MQPAEHDQKTADIYRQRLEEEAGRVLLFISSEPTECCETAEGEAEENVTLRWILRLTLALNRLYSEKSVARSVVHQYSTS